MHPGNELISWHILTELYGTTHDKDIHVPLRHWLCYTFSLHYMHKSKERNHFVKLTVKPRL